MKLTVEPSKADPIYVYYFFMAPETVQRIHNQAFSSGVPHINLEILRAFEIDLPELPGQRRIASILSAYDDLLENNTRRIKILEEMAQMLYREWFVNFRFPGHQKVKMAESELGAIPDGWASGTISQIAILRREGINPVEFPDELFVHFSIPSFDNSRTPVREKGTEIKSNKYLVVPGCVLLSKLNPRIPRLWMPSLGSGLREITSTEFLVLTPSVGRHRTYLFQFLSSEEFNSSLTGLSLGTSTSHQRVKPDDFLNLPALLPARSAIDDFCRNVDPMMEELSVLRSKNMNLRTTRDFLLPKLISGEIPIEAVAELVEQAV
jgi:type I restriction enzyme S subunit